MRCGSAQLLQSRAELEISTDISVWQIMRFYKESIQLRMGPLWLYYFPFQNIPGVLQCLQSQVPNPGSWLMYSHSNPPYLVAFSLGPLLNKTKKTWMAQFFFLGFVIWFEPSHEDWQLSNASIIRISEVLETGKKTKSLLLVSWQSAKLGLKWKWIRSVVSDSLQPHGLWPTRLLHPWDFPGKSTGVGDCSLLIEASNI